MAQKKNKGKSQSQKLSPIERVLRKKADQFLRAEREFWKYRYELEEQHRQNAKALGLDIPFTIPEDLSTVVWALKDGVAFVRHQSPGRKGNVSFRSANISLEQWGNEWLIIPTSRGEISLAKSGVIKGLGNLRVGDLVLNDFHMGYIELAHAYYDKEQLPSGVEKAIIDFQLAFLGAQLRDQPAVSPNKYVENTDETINKLHQMATHFENLLDNAEREEELQIFLKENPMVLHPTSELIPKKKLGEDFITDFVLIAPSDQGPKYTLVEIEKVSHRIINSDNSLSAASNHAIKQTQDWDVWLESNKAYLQQKLPGFETPNYLVVIGRGNTLDGTAKTYLRSYNRSWKNIELLTYDDVLIRFKGVISALTKATQPNAKR